MRNPKNRSSCTGFGAKFVYSEFLLVPIAAIYKVRFDNGNFYIGSTANMKERISFYRRSFSNGIHLSKKFKESVEASVTATIELIEEILPEFDLKATETYYISSYFGNPSLVNRSKDAKSNKGITWTAEEREKMSKGLMGIIRPESTREKHRQRMRDRVKNNHPTRGKKLSEEHKAAIGMNRRVPVESLDKNGNILKKYACIRHAAADNNCSNTSISMVCRGKKADFKGIVYKYAL